MRSLLPKRPGTLVLALALAVIVWAAANAEQNPEVTGVFPSSIPVEVSNVPPGLVVYGSVADKVTLKIRAPQDSWSRLRADSFRAYVDMSGRSAGLHEVEIKVNSSDPRVRILEKDPHRLSVRLEPLREKVVPVRVRPVDDAPPGYSLQVPRATPPQVTIRGPAPLADSVSEAFVEIRLEGSKVSFTKSYQPVLRDFQGKEVKGVDYWPVSVQVEVPIERIKNYKTVSIKAVITGTVAPGYWISNVVVQPATVTFGGDPQVLETFGYVETSPVDVSGATKEIVRSVSIYIPPGTALEKKEEVFVKVSVEPIPGGGIVRRTITVRNLAKGLTPTLSQNWVDLRLEAPLPVLQHLQPTDISVSIDASGLLTGTYEVPVQVTGVPTGAKVIAIIPDKVAVTFK